MARAMEKNSGELIYDDKGEIGDFLALMKPRVMSLVIFTAFIGMIMAPGTVHPVIGGSALILIAVGAGASAVLNMWYDADIDIKMQRTQARPIPAQRVSRDAALSFGLWLSALSVFSMAVLINYLAAGLLAFTIFFYAVIYTMWLKRRTPQNIVIGGAAGALPPVIGWACATNALSMEPLIYFIIIFLWTPPHFWALALRKGQEYADANVPMLPNIIGAKASAKQIMLYTLLLGGAALMPYIMGFAGLIYAVPVGILSVIFLLLTLWLYAVKDEKRNHIAGGIFAYSIFYLFLLFALLPVDRILV